ncbi:MAG: hypothetical protein ABJE66_05580 [Deltaproteobacteria bacterium]
MKAAGVIGVAIVAAHALGFVALASRSAGQDLEVELRAPLASPVLMLDGVVPAAIEPRVVETVDAPGPGLRRKRWRVDYRGGFTREVGATQLVGPFQDSKVPACSGRVIVGQALLDQIAVAMRGVISDQLRGETIFPVGAYHSIDAFTLEWARFETHPFDVALLGAAGAPHGYVRATARIAFDRVTVPIVLVAVPERADTELHFRVQASARVEVANGFLEWLNSKVDLTSKLATRLANHELDAMLVTALAPPPPFELAGGQTLAFTFCADPVEISDRAYGVLPFAVVIGNAPGGVLPPHLPSIHAPPAAPSSIAIDLDVDALNAMLYELWRTGWLDRQLAEVGLDRRFNTDPTVTEMLTVRLSPLRLALPPVISRAGDHLRLAADARVNLSDGGLTVARVYGALDLRFATNLAPAVTLGALELACERTPTTLVPCYADLVGALATRSADFDGALTTAFGALLREIFVDRELSVGELPFSLHVAGVVPTLGTGVHLELDAKLVK